MKKTLWISGSLLGLFLIARAISWPLSVDVNDPATYVDDWGGPTLIGTVAVHCGPGLACALILVTAVIRGRMKARRSSAVDPAPPPTRPRS